MKIAVLGYGTVGAGVYELVGKEEGLSQGPVLVLPNEVNASFMKTNIKDIITDDVDVVVEAIGGISAAYKFVKLALEAGKHVVTSNKALVAAHGIELGKIARENHVGFRFSAACGGGIPILSSIVGSRSHEEILEVGGIFNGTTNYILDAMFSDGLSPAEALAHAKLLGYAEADPHADLCGLDTMRKIILASAVAFDILPSDENIICEGIEALDDSDVKALKNKGLTVRLIGKTANLNIPSLYVMPAVISENSPAAKAKKNCNYIYFKGSSSDINEFMGEGAGRYPTASNVISDIKAIQSGDLYMLGPSCRDGELSSNIYSNFYVRTDEATAEDLPYIHKENDGKNARLITDKMLLCNMYHFAIKARNEGHQIFFATCEENIC